MYYCCRHVSLYDHVLNALGGSRLTLIEGSNLCCSNWVRRALLLNYLYWYMKEFRDQLRQGIRVPVSRI